MSEHTLTRCCHREKEENCLDAFDELIALSEEYTKLSREENQLSGCNSHASFCEPQTDYVWYACYGPNLSIRHFMGYINRCSDKSPPIETKPYEFMHNIYFAKHSTTWDNGGKAFLDDTAPGFAYGRIYKIKRSQFIRIKELEGSDYRKPLVLDMIDGLPVYSFTDRQKNEHTRTPSNKYFAAILKGLIESHGTNIPRKELTEYLIHAIFPINSYNVAKAIKQSPHRLSNSKISARTGLSMDETTQATKWLIEHGIIQLDLRSAVANRAIDTPEAEFFTVDSANARGLIIQMIQAEEDI